MTFDELRLDLLEQLRVEDLLGRELLLDPVERVQEVDQGLIGKVAASGEPRTGLGLWVSAGIVSAHAGRIWAESRPGRGATLIVELPVA